jgi:hypothetical protein
MADVCSDESGRHDAQHHLETFTWRSMSMPFPKGHERIKLHVILPAFDFRPSAQPARQSVTALS